MLTSAPLCPVTHKCFPSTVSWIAGNVLISRKLFRVLKPQVWDCYLQNSKPKASWSVWHEPGKVATVPPRLISTISTQHQLSLLNTNKSHDTLAVLTALRNNHKLLRLRSLLPVCLLCSVNNPQIPALNGLEESGGVGVVVVLVVGVNLHPQPSSFNSSFFLKFYVQGHGPVKT